MVACVVVLCYVLDHCCKVGPSFAANRLHVRVSAMDDQFRHVSRAPSFDHALQRGGYVDESTFSAPPYFFYSKGGAR